MKQQAIVPLGGYLDPAAGGGIFYGEHDAGADLVDVVNNGLFDARAQ